jgi:hypothetical protein
MASLIVAGDTSGTVTLQAPAVAGSTVLTLPTTSGTLVTTAGGSTVPFALGSAASPSITFTGDTNTGMFSPGADTIAFSEGGVESMRIDSTGNVGIGTSSPARKLQVHEATAATNAYFQLSNAATGSGATDGFQAIVGTGGEIILVQRENAEMQFWTNNTERMRIDSSGKLLVGRAADGGNNGTFQITAPTNSAVADFRINSSSGSQNAIDITNSANAAYNAFRFWQNGYGATLCGQIQCNGSTTTYASGSDYRLKENIAPMIGALEKITKLKPVTFNWIADKQADNGFIAHELQEVFPSAVTGNKDAVDEEGNPQYQGIDTSFLVATLTAAIQEQQAIIQSQADTITAMETRLTALENK